MEDRSSNHREPIRLPDFLNQDVGDSTQPDNERSGIAWGQIIALVLAAGFSLVVVEALFSPNSLRNDSRVSNHVHTVVSAGHDSIDVPAAALIVFGLPAIALLVRSVFKPTVFQTALTLIAANWISVGWHPPSIDLWHVR